MTYQIGQVTRKQAAGKDIIECNVKGDDGKITKVTIWKTDKDGKEFPNFDQISAGSIVEGNLWNKAGTDNWTLYPPKPIAQRFNGSSNMMVAKTNSIKEAQNRKEQAIGTAQDRNEVMYAKQGAAMIIAHHPAYKDLNDLNLSYTFQNLVRTIYNFNPQTSLSPTHVDEEMIIKSTKQEVEYPANEINPNDVPF